MRNFLGGLIGAVVGSTITVYFLGISSPNYPESFTSIWFFLVGSEILKSTNQYIPPTHSTLIIICTWLIIGVILSFFSESTWNGIRTTIWTGAVIAIFSLISILLLDPVFWVSESRNWDLVIHFSESILYSLFSLITTAPLVFIRIKIQRKKEIAPPERIETICECGAVFKSKPMLCSVCGKTLAESNEISNAGEINDLD